MYKNQLQELAQRSCFNLPSYTCIREGPDHAPRFKATVNFNGDTYDCPNYCTTLRQAEHSAAEVALNALATYGPSNSLAARILDETGVYKNLLQEVSQRVGASLPTYTTFRSGFGHSPVFTCTVDLAGCIFTGESAKNKKQAEKNAAVSAWSSLKLVAQQSESSLLQEGKIEEQEHVTVARALQKFRLKARMTNIPFPIRFPPPKPKLIQTQYPLSTTSKILPFICPTVQTLIKTSQSNKHVFPAIEAAPYVPVGYARANHGIVPPVTIRNSIPVFAAPPRPSQLPPLFGMPTMRTTPPVVNIRRAVPVFAAPIPPLLQEKANVEDVLKPFATSSPEEKTSSVLGTVKEEENLKEVIGD